MLQSGHNAEEERRKYVLAFNSTMIKIWRERIALLKVVDTGALYRSAVSVGLSIDGKVSAVTLSQAFNTYGLFQDYGTGREVPVGNPGDIGRDMVRLRRKWFSTKYYASVMNLKEFFADNLGRDFCGIVANALNDRSFHQSLLK